MVNTGYFIRIQRDGKFLSEDIGNLTRSELEEWVRGIEDPKRLQSWMIALVQWIQTRVTEVSE